MARRLFIVLWLCSFATGSRAEERADSTTLIQGHACRFHIYPEQSAIECRDTLLISRAESKRAPLQLRLWRGFSVDTCLVGGTAAAFERSSDRLVLKDLPSDPVVQVVVAYSARTNASSEFSRLTRDRAIFRMEEFLPSTAAPRTAPLTSLTVTVVVPEQWRVAAPADTITETTEAGERTVRCSLHAPIPMMGWVCAGAYVRRQEQPVTVDLFPEDSSAARSIIGEALRVLRFYGDNFRPYRFARLNIVECEDWVAGPGVLAIAMPAMIMVKQRALQTDTKFDRVEAILPHEIAHQWWAMTVFVGDEDNALLSEGMCEYSAYIYGELNGRTSARDSLSRHPLLRPLLFRIQQKKDAPLRRKADLRSEPTQYLKALYVQHMLRKIIGDSAAFRLYRLWADRYALQYGTQEEFQALAEEVSGQHLGWFFEQWTGEKGVPRLRLYNVKAENAGSGWATRGRVRLVGYERYTLPIDVVVRAGRETERKRVWIGADSGGAFHNDVGFEIHTASRPSVALLDPSGDVLKVQKIPVKLSDLREPGDAVFIVGSGRDASHLLDLARSDSAAMEKAGWSIDITPDTTVTLGSLQRDHVVLYGMPETNTIVREQQSRFPYVVRNDSVVVGGEEVSDSSLTLVQAIENPYIPGGMMVWIAPLGNKATAALLPYESSWVLLRDNEEIESGTWEERDEDLEVEIKGGGGTMNNDQ